RFMARAVELNPELERDTATRISLALGQIADQAAGWTELLAAIGQRPELQDAVEAAIRTYWAGFAELEEAERLEWIAGLYAIHVIAPKTGALATAWSRQAGLAFLTVTECQLRRNVFEPMRQEVLRDPAFFERVRSLAQENIFARYLGS